MEMAATSRRFPMPIGRALAAVAVVAAMLAQAEPASAFCHIAAFRQAQVSVSEDAGSVTLTVALTGGQPSCAGTVDYTTAPGTAQSPGDYQHKQGSLTFVTNDDREETITIPIVDDASPEQSETFQVVLSNPTGTVTGTGGDATVTIADNDATQEPAESPSPSPSPTATKKSPSPSPAQTESPSPTATPSPSPTTSELPSPSPVTEPEDGGGGFPTGLVAGIGAAVAVAAGGALWWFRRRAAQPR